MANPKSVPSLMPPESTQLDQIPRLTDSLRQTFQSGRTKSVEYRLVQLRRLYWGLVDYETLIVEALNRDLRRCRHETVVMELELLREDCLYAIENLTHWAKDDSVEGIPLAFWLLRQRIRKEPLGLVLIIGAFNYPVLLSIGPLIGAIAAGCTAIIKPSEGAPAAAMAIQQLLHDWLDRDSYAVVNGAIPEATALLDQRWDKIFYTGNQTVGRIVARRAAETATPVVLELGGLNPAIVTRHANVELAGRRILWAVVANAGQTCVKPNYVLVERSVLPLLTQAFRSAHASFFPGGAHASPEYSRINNKKSFLRIKSIADRSGGEVVLGGEMDEADLFVEPTIILVHSIQDPIIQEESFGPLLGLLPFDTLDEAIGTANTVCPTPLSLSSFGSKEENKRVLSTTTSGGASLNDAFIHASIIPAPFGGVGTSGTGSYRGKASFDSFTHRRTVATTPAWFEPLVRVRYLPYLAQQLRLRQFIGPRPDFDRNGKPLWPPSRWLFWLLRLGSPSRATFTSVLLRWAILIFAAYLAKMKNHKCIENFKIPSWGGN